MIRALVVLAFLISIEVSAQGNLAPTDRVSVAQNSEDRKDFGWSQSPDLDLTAPGPTTLHMAVCPDGVRGDEPYYYIYIFDDAQSEAARVTGGTCSGDGRPGTLQLTTLKAHQSGYRIGSASGGIQEALIAARFTPTNPTVASQAGRVIVPPGEYKLYAGVSVRSSAITLDLSGSILDCYTTSP